MSDINKNNSDNTSEKKEKSAVTDDRIMDTRDLVYKEGGYLKDPRAVVENPAVTPEMLNEPGDLRGDLNEED